MHEAFCINFCQIVDDLVIIDSTQSRNTSNLRFTTSKHSASVCTRQQIDL